MIVVRTHRIADVAEQSGLSPATVDRVLHGRAGASPRAVRAVEQAVAELDRQQRSLRLGARALVVDVVMQAPGRFSDQVRAALESQLAAVGPAAVRARFDARESGTSEEVAERLDAVGRRGRTSHGVLLKAPDDPVVATAVTRLHERGIPTVTLVTDVHESPRIAYVGPDNESAGRTAAYLVARWVPERAGSVLVSVSRTSFAGETSRAQAFAGQLAVEAPGAALVEVTDADGLDRTTSEGVRAALAEVDDLVAVYSVGGGNRATTSVLAELGLRPRVYVGHDLDDDNRELLRSGVIDVVLHHDLRADMRAALRQLLRHHGLLAGAPTSVPAEVQVVTPFNIPARLPSR